MEREISLEGLKNKYFNNTETLRKCIAKDEVCVRCGKFDGKDIVWLVCDTRNDNEILLLSKKGLCQRPYNDKDGGVSWEGSSLYRWLNNDFLNENIVKFEKDEMYNAIVDLPQETQNPIYFLEEFNVNSPVNKVTLLSKEQAEKMFNITKDRKSDKAKCYSLENSSVISWWLCSQEDFYRAYYVNIDGRLCSELLTASNFICIRPTMWVDLSKL